MSVLPSCLGRNALNASFKIYLWLCRCFGTMFLIQFGRVNFKLCDTLWSVGPQEAWIIFSLAGAYSFARIASLTISITAGSDGFFTGRN